MPNIPTHVTLLANGGELTVSLYDLAVWVIVGLSAGFLASRLLLGHGLGPVRELLIGVIGGVVGNLAFAFFHVTIAVAGYPVLSQIIVAFCGALALVLVMRLVGLGRHRRDRDDEDPERPGGAHGSRARAWRRGQPWDSDAR